MFNIFPELLFLAPASALLIRSGVAAVFFTAALTHWKKRHENPHTFIVITIAEIAVASFLAVGLYTQLAAAAGALIAVVWIMRSHLRPMPLSTMFLLLIMSISLVLTGAGPLSFDLPL